MHCLFSPHAPYRYGVLSSAPRCAAAAAAAAASLQAATFETQKPMSGDRFEGYTEETIENRKSVMSQKALDTDIDIIKMIDM